jgi:hypothetical protein
MTSVVSEQLERVVTHSADYIQHMNSDSIHRLDRIMARRREGYSVDLRSPFYGGIDRNVIAEKFQVLDLEFEELISLDRKERDDIGPFSIMLPFTEIVDSVQAYFSQYMSPDPEALKYAYSQVSSLLPHHGLRMMKLSTSFGMMPRDTNLGLPFLSRDRSLAIEYLRRAEQLRDPSEIFPCVLGWRGQANGTDRPKQRVVWMFDHAETILGSSILHPVLDVLRSINGFSAWSTPLDVDNAVTRILKVGEEAGVPIISMDFSAFDSSVPRGMITLAFDLLRDWYSEMARERINLLEEIFATVSLVCPDKLWTGRDGGVPSGSALTNLIDTLINLLVGFYASYRLGVDLIDYELLGDDSVFVFTPGVAMEKLSEVIGELGMTSNPEKQFISYYSAHYL